MRLLLRREILIQNLIPLGHLVGRLGQHSLSVTLEGNGADQVAIDDGVNHLLVGSTFYRPEDRMLAVQPGGGHMGDEKLAAVGAGPALAMERIPGRSCLREASNSSAKL